MSSRCNVEPHDKKGNVFHRKLFPFTFNEKLHRSFKDGEPDTKSNIEYGMNGPYGKVFK